MSHTICFLRSMNLFNYDKHVSRAVYFEVARVDLLLNRITQKQRKQKVSWNQINLIDKAPIGAAQCEAKTNNLWVMQNDKAILAYCDFNFFP